ncbi:MAG: hypothetical protein MOGMAGMI_02080 [Candidatus Omnitrophica bacterium]|nr:hypothetical protein [Candidatus Omnitrophota bacterium]
MRVYAQTKTVLRVSGRPDQLLKGYATNDADKPETAFVDLKGRVVAVALHRKLSAEESLLVVGTAYVERLIQHLSKYLPLLDVELRPDPSYRVYLHLEYGVAENPPDLYVIRHRDCETLLSSAPMDVEVTRAEYDLYRMSRGLAEQGEDFDEELLLNVYDDSHVSYTKGCFLGQEILARVHHRSHPPKRLAALTREACPAGLRAAMTSVAYDPAVGQDRGFVLLPYEQGTARVQ